MGEERLSGIALLNIERNFEINLDQIVTDFIVKKDIRKILGENFMRVLKANER